MRLHRKLPWILAAQLFWIASAFAQSYKVEAIGALTSADVPKPAQDMLAAQGARVVSDQGGALCEVWMRKTVPANPSPSGSSDILFGPLAEGTFLGVVHYTSPGSDFRGQAIKAGYYTLRYTLIPQDGNHMGVNPSRDAIHLCPIAADTDLGKTLTVNDLIKLGRLASGTPHPAFLVMAPASGGTFPSVLKDDLGNWDLQVQVHGEGKDFPVAITVVGKWQG
jgi:hypothetical protein